MGIVSLLSAVFSFGAELFKYLREKEGNNKECAVKLREAKDALSIARKTKDTSKLESAFSNIGLGRKPE